jgi:hypothetical protein
MKTATGDFHRMGHSSRRRIQQIRWAGAILLLVIVFLAEEANAKRQMSPGELQSACEAASGVILDTLSSMAQTNDAISDTAPELPPLAGHELEIWEGGWKGEKPGRGLLSRWHELYAPSAIRCPQVKVLIPKSTSVVHLVSPDTLVEAGSSSFFIKISVPILNKAGTRGVFLIGRSGNRLGGYAILVTISKRDGVWRKSGRRIVYGS